MFHYMYMYISTENPAIDNSKTQTVEELHVKMCPQLQSQKLWMSFSVYVYVYVYVYMLVHRHTNVCILTRPLFIKCENSQLSKYRPHPWKTNYWQLPESKHRGMKDPVCVHPAAVSSYMARSMLAHCLHSTMNTKIACLLKSTNHGPILQCSIFVTDIFLGSPYKESLWVYPTISKKANCHLTFMTFHI